MSTRYHLKTGAIPINPSFSPYWNSSAASDRQIMGTGYNIFPSNSVETKKISADSGPLLILNRQYISEFSLNQSSINGSFTGQIQSYGIGSYTTGNDGTAKNNFLIKIVNNSGSTKATIYSGTANSTVLNTTIETNRSFSGNLNAYSGISGGDYLVIEYGFLFIKGSFTGNYNWSGSQRFGNYLLNSDLPMNNFNQSTNQNSWIEFSQNI